MLIVAEVVMGVVVSACLMESGVVLAMMGEVMCMLWCQASRCCYSSCCCRVVLNACFFFLLLLMF